MRLRGTLSIAKSEKAMIDPVVEIETETGMEIETRATRKSGPTQRGSEISAKIQEQSDHICSDLDS
jgi:hypothetical protein